MTPGKSPSRGEIWLADFDPIRGHEQAGRRPALIISDNRLNRGRSRLVFAVPLTTRQRNLPSHVAVTPPNGGLRAASYIMCEQLRSISTERLIEGPWGIISEQALTDVEDRLRLLLRL